MAWPRGWQWKGEKGSDSGYIVKVEMTGFAEGLEGGERKTGVRISPTSLTKQLEGWSGGVVLVV